MNKYLFRFLVMLIMVIGLSLIIFIFRMIWFPPEAMGIMMGREMMVYHMGVWMFRTFFFILVITVVMLLIINKKK